ncbi:MAG: hypothetical protein M3N13_03430 [Candidatus Eremiobacteraeota bacterium]|nr:hypothetical protein [Candidatus Eremiobacteraeota bacterium]
MRTANANAALLAAAVTFAWPASAAGGAQAQHLCWQHGHVPAYVFLANADVSHAGSEREISGDDVTRLFAKSGITLTSDVPNAVTVADDRRVYGGAGVSTTFHDIEIRNVIMQKGRSTPAPDGSTWVSYTLTFNAPVRAVAFERVPLIAGPNGTIHPEWIATARDPDGAVVATAHQDLIQTYVHVDSRMFFLQSPGDKLIRSVTFAGNHHGIAAYANLVIDALLWCS